MILQKLSAFLLVFGLAFQTIASAAPSPTPDIKNDELSPELKQNVLKLLSELAGETAQFALPENRVATQTIIAGLLWEHDQTAARAVYQSVFVELQNLFADINAADIAEMNDAERNKLFYKRLRLANLRRDYVLTLARHDSPAALNAFAALKANKVGEGYDPLDPSRTELQLASTIAKKDPDKTFALAKEQIAAKGVTLESIESLKELHKKDSALAARIGREFLAGMKTARIRVPPAGGVDESNEAATTTTDANSAASQKQAEIEFWTISTFINTASELNRRAARDKTKKMQPLLAEAEMREIVESAARAFLSARKPAPYAVSYIMEEINLYSPALAQQIRVKVGAKVFSEFDRLSESFEYSRTEKEKTADELAQIADRSAPEARDRRYADAVRRALEENDPEKARAIAERIKDRENYGYMFEQIKSAAPVARARRGDLVEVRRMLAALKTNQERIAALTELATAVAAKGDNKTAKNLLDESRQMMSAVVKTQTDLDSVIKIANAYSSIAPEEAFPIVENGVRQMNDYLNAAILLNEFYGSDSIETGELFYDAINKISLLYVPQTTGLLKNLAAADFERAVNLADKFARPEVRLLVRLRVAQTLLDAEAAEKEKKLREQAESEDKEH